MIILQPRDRTILRLCYEQQFLLIEQIQRFLFLGTDRQNSVRRCQQLERFGYIRSIVEPTLDGKRLIRLTDLGRRIIEKDLVIEVPQVNKPDVRTLHHDAAVTTVRLRLQELWTGSWLPERAIKRQDFPQIPDGLFIFPSGKKVAVEVENSIKGRSRLLALLERWRRVDVKLVLYVATVDNIFSHLKRCLADGPRTVPLSLIHYQRLLASDPSVWTPDKEVEVFARKEY